MSCIFFVTPMLIIALYITGAEVPEAHALSLANYALEIQNEDGGWPTYTYGAQTSTLMGTTLMYVAMRLMGFGENHDSMIRARKNLLSMGGAVRLPCCKFGRKKSR
jgi:lanosterol synthase